MQSRHGSSGVLIPVLNEMPKCLIAFSLLSIIFLSTEVNIAFADVEKPVVSVVPEFSIVVVGQGFQINVSVDNSTNLYAWEFKLFYLIMILNCTGAAEGPLLKSFGPTIFVKQIKNDYNSTHGRVLLTCTLQGSAVADGTPGVLATMTFKAKRGGNSALDLVDTKLRDPSLPPVPIDHTAVDGTVHVVGNIHDVAVIGIVSSKNGGIPKPVVGSGQTTWTNVTVENHGDFDETFSILIYANATQVGSFILTDMPWGTRATVRFVWNTTGFAYGNYQLSTQATTVFNESDVADNNLTDGSLMVSIPGDVDGNLAVNILDVVRITGCYMSKRGQTQYNPSADLNDNDLVNILDVVICTGRYGQHYP